MLRFMVRVMVIGIGFGNALRIEAGLRVEPPAGSRGREPLERKIFCNNRPPYL